jgi:CRISPR-associated protein Cas1
VSFRTVVIKNRSKLEYQTNYLIVRGENTNKIHLSEISLLIIQTTAVAVTAVLLCELAKRHIKVIFCDEKYNPCFECLPYYGGYQNSRRIQKQINWKKSTKELVWTHIIYNKIKEQQKILLRINHVESAKLLESYLDELEVGDKTNREGHAAKVYFNTLFGTDFSRANKELFINHALDYGYTVLLSSVNRIIVSSGYLTQLGIWHNNEYNDFNLGSDLMEPFRPLVDYIVLKLEDNDKDFKKKLNGLLNYQVRINNQMTHLGTALVVYLRSVFEALEKNDPFLIKFIEGYAL